MAEQLAAHIKDGGKISVLNLANGAGHFSTFIRNHFQYSLGQLITVCEDKEML